MKRFLTLLFIVSVLMLVSTLPMMNIKTVSVEGDMVVHPLLEDWLKGQNWLWTSSKHMLVTINDIYDANIKSIKKTGFLSVTVTTDQAQAYVAIKSGELFVLIDRYGTVIGLSPFALAQYELDGFKVMVSEVGREIVVKDIELLDKAISLVAMLEEVSHFDAKVKQVDGKIIIQTPQGIEIDFGRGRQLDRQLHHALLIYDELIALGATSTDIDVSNPDNTFTKPKGN